MRGGTKIKAVIYARYSSDSQREESIKGQIRECTAFAEKNDITITPRYRPSLICENGQPPRISEHDNREKRRASEIKRFLILFYAFALCLGLAACDPVSYSFDYEEVTQGLVSVELINYDNPTQESFVSWVPDHSDDLLPFDETKMTVLKGLDPEKYEEFVRQLCKTNILYKYYAYDSPNGPCLELSYENGDFLIISCNSQPESFHGYIGKFSPGGEVSDFIGCFSSYRYFEELVYSLFVEEP